MKNNKGITLIALVITIIVMLILVGVTISMAVNGGLFNYAGNAVGDTRNALNDEQLLTNTDIIDYYVNRKPAVTALKAYSTDLLNDKGVLDENTKYESGYNIAVIPKGFRVSDVASEQTIAGGLVIEDAEGNQFVWIPVRDGEFKRTGWLANEPIDGRTQDEVLENVDEEYLKQDIAIAMDYNSMDELIAAYGCNNYEELLVLVEAQYGVDNTIDMYKLTYYGITSMPEDCTENLLNDPTGEYENMIASVNKYGGFYIGRYEAGSNENRKETRTDETVLIKKGAYPYIRVLWGTSMTDYETADATYGHGAVYLSRNMYTNKEEYGVTSTLCYGVQWDATLRFLRDEYNVTESTAWGNYVNHEFIFTGKYTLGVADGPFKDDTTTKPKGEVWQLTTGASEENKAKNIYDFAGNAMEWTMEAGSSTTRVLRGGGNGDYYGYTRPACSREIRYEPGEHCHAGFRPTLYIK